MQHAEMDQLIERHLAAERAADTAGSVAVYSDDVEHDTTVTVPGEFLGVAGNGRRITFRLLHVWVFRDGLISRENVWLDGGAVIAQLTAPETVGTSA